MQFPIGGHLKPSLYLTSLIVEICVKHLAKHVPIENALIPIYVLGGKIGGYSILQLCGCIRSLGTSFEFLTATIGLRALLLRFLDLPIENALRRLKNKGKIGEGVIGL